MKTSVKTAIIFVIAVTLVVASFLFERRTVRSLMPEGEARTIGPFEFVETASYDGFLFRDGTLYDAYSLTPKVLQEKDCPT